MEAMRRDVRSRVGSEGEREKRMDGGSDGGRQATRNLLFASGVYRL